MIDRHTEEILNKIQLVIVGQNSFSIIQSLYIHILLYIISTSLLKIIVGIAEITRFIFKWGKFSQMTRQAYLNTHNMKTEALRVL